MFAEPCLQQLRIRKVKQSQHCECALIVAQAALSKFWWLSFSFVFSVCPRVTHNEKGLAFVGELVFRQPITEAQ